MSETIKKGHPVLAVILGILGILAALFLCLLTGVIGGAIAGVLGLGALLIGILGKKGGGKGVGGIITGALAILLAVILTVTSIASLKLMKEKAVEAGTAPLIEKYLDDPTMGLLGVALKIPQEEGSLEELTQELNTLK